MLTQSRLKRILHYDPATGAFIRYRPAGSSSAGLIRNTPNSDGYIRIGVEGVSYKAHRLAFIYMLCYCPDAVDHINGITTDNRWDNLREATKTINGRNQKKRKTNTTGIMGVTWHSRDNKWHARINTEKGRLHLGNSTDFFEACCLRKSAENRHDYHQNHGR